MIERLVPHGLWERVAPLLPPPKPRRHRYPGRRPIDDRAAQAVHPGQVGQGAQNGGEGGDLVALDHLALGEHQRGGMVIAAGTTQMCLRRPAHDFDVPRDRLWPS